VSSESPRHDRFEAITAEVYEPLQRYLRRRAPADDAGDLLADALLTIWRRLDDVPTEVPLPWCYGVARRILANHRRGAQRHLRLVERLEAEPLPASTPGPAESLADADLVDALARLPAADQEILRLWAWEQLEPREIAQVMGSTSNAVSLRLTRANKKLAEALSRQDPSAGGQIGIDTPRSKDDDRRTP
jgi:RNA polymerase sigma-70 factor (ECF subfamily)